MDADLMLRWFKTAVLPYTKGRRALLIIDSFSAHEDQDFTSEANKENVDVVVIPGGCTSKVQPLDVCLNKPFKSLLRGCWQEYIDSLVSNDPDLKKLKTASKETICQWVQKGLDDLRKKEKIVKKSFLVCGLSNALDGSENKLIRCAKELLTMQLPYVDESDDDPFRDEESDDDKDAESESDECEDEDNSD